MNHVPESSDCRVKKRWEMTRQKCGIESLLHEGVSDRNSELAI